MLPNSLLNYEKVDFVFLYLIFYCLRQTFGGTKYENPATLLLVFFIVYSPY